MINAPASGASTLVIHPQLRGRGRGMKGEKEGKERGRRKARKGSRRKEGVWKGRRRKGKIWKKKGER